jgi:hypothetical protein
MLNLVPSQTYFRKPFKGARFNRVGNEHDFLEIQTSIKNYRRIRNGFAVAGFSGVMLSLTGFWILSPLVAGIQDERLNVQNAQVSSGLKERFNHALAKIFLLGSVCLVLASATEIKLRRFIYKHLS